MTSPSRSLTPIDNTIAELAKEWALEEFHDEIEALARWPTSTAYRQAHERLMFTGGVEVGTRFGRDGVSVLSWFTGLHGFIAMCQAAVAGRAEKD